MSNRSLHLSLSSILMLGLACTSYTVAPDGGGGGDGLPPDHPSSSPDLVTERGADQTMTEVPADMMSGACADPTQVNSCGAACAVCPVPNNADHATCDGMKCGLVCKTGFHACDDGTCADNASVNSCGSACKPCGVPTGGSATCNAGVCGMSCPTGSSLCVDKCIPTGTACNGACTTGMHSCSGACKADTDANFCGLMCEHCSAPQNGMAMCNGACGVKCNNGFNLCGTSCKAANDPTACGPNCIRCDAPTGGMATCDGTKCGTPTCPNGQKICNNACIDSNRSCNGVCSNGKYNCPDGVCRDTNTTASCGTGCQACPNPGIANAASACQNGQCGFACSAGFERCGSMSRCQMVHWGFEDGAEGFTQDTIGGTGATITTVNGGHSGAKALASQVTAQFAVEQIYVGASVGGMCSGTGLPVQARTASAWVKVVGQFGDDTGCRLDAHKSSNDVDVGQDIAVTTGQWTRLTAAITSGSLDGIQVTCFAHASAAGALEMDVDDIAIE